MDRLVLWVERCRRTAANWSGLPQAGRRYIRTGRIIGLMGHSCVWTRWSRPRLEVNNNKKKERLEFNICSPLKRRRRRRRTEAETFFGTGWKTPCPQIHLLQLQGKEVSKHAKDRGHGSTSSSGFFHKHDQISEASGTEKPGNAGKAGPWRRWGTSGDGEPEVDAELIPADETGISSDSI